MVGRKCRNPFLFVEGRIFFAAHDQSLNIFIVIRLGLFWFEIPMRVNKPKPQKPSRHCFLGHSAYAMSLPPLSFLHVIRNLKVTPRTGWVNHSVPNPGNFHVLLVCCSRTESISDHMYRMAVILMIMPIPEGIDKSKYSTLSLSADVDVWWWLWCMIWPRV